MEKSTFDLLEFDKILQLISLHSRSEASARAILGIQPLCREEIGKRQGLLGEIMRMSFEGNPLGIESFPDISGLLAKVKPEGAVLDGIEISGFIPVLSVASETADQIAAAGNVPLLEDLTAELTGFPDIQRTLNKSVDAEGHILDTASPRLADLRDRTRRLDARIRKSLEELVRDERISPFLQDDFITKRSGRWVIPVRMDSKGQVSGVVHDISKSGETAFMEPLAIIGPANELENLFAEQKAEEIRILRSISSVLRRSAAEIDGEFRTIVHLDLLNAIAKFALDLEMEIPLINDSGEIMLTGARHPLLLLAFKKTGERKVVPLELRLSGKDTVMVITGSNAGGKTIAIKTIGLLLLMALSGMPVAAGSSSSFPFVENILVDIGDEQSIENSLSTFSAHVSNISRILKTAVRNTLVLLDELGTGTDPEEGAALACAVLKELGRSGALIFATTHLSDIKGFVHRTEGMLNASMEFDREKLTPLYSLRIGEPGQSHALETAKRYGLPETIVDSAKAMLGGVKVEFDNLIADLNRKRNAYEDAGREAEKLKAELEMKDRLVEQRLREVDDLKKKILGDAYREASDLLLDAQRKVNALLDELKKTEKEKSREMIREAKRKISEDQKKISVELGKYAIEEGDGAPPEEIAEGDTIFAKSLGRDATIVQVNTKLGRVKVRAGSIEIDLPASDLRKKKGRGVETKSAAELSTGDEEMPSSRLNIVGLRVEEALSKLEPFLNHASLAGLTEVVVIHGIGAGILSRAVGEHLTRHPLVRNFRRGEKNEGGAGVTVVMLA